MKDTAFFKLLRAKPSLLELCRVQPTFSKRKRAWEKLRFNLLQPLLNRKTRTLFSYTRKIPVPENRGIRKILAETLEKLLHRHFLRQGTGISRLPVLIQTTLVADADAVGIVVAGMSTHLTLRAARIERTILCDVVVVAHRLETSCLMAGFQSLYGKILVHTGCTAVQHYQIDFSHVLKVF